jgi:hypothetical protein
MRVIRNGFEYSGATEVLRRRTVVGTRKQALDPGSTSEGLRRTAPLMSRNRYVQREEREREGFSLEDVRELLDLSSSDCDRVEKLAAEKLNLVKAKLKQLRRIESVLAKTVEQCARRKGNQPCPIIETLSEMK